MSSTLTSTIEIGILGMHGYENTWHLAIGDSS